MENNPKIHSLVQALGFISMLLFFWSLKANSFTDVVRLELDQQNKCYFKHHNGNNVIKIDGF